MIARRCQFFINYYYITIILLLYRLQNKTCFPVQFGYLVFYGN